MNVKIVAELSGNHLGSKGRAHQLIDAAADAGADAIKTQCYVPEDMAAAGARVRFGPIEWQRKEYRELYAEAQTPLDWQYELAEHIHDRGVEWIVTPFSPHHIAPLEQLNPAAYKIASFEFDYLDLLDEVLKTGRPVIISTGVATNLELVGVVLHLHAQGKLGGDWPSDRLTLLHCVSQYPTPLSAVNLGRIAELRELLGTKWVGFSDHTVDTEVAPLAAALGATVIEKHFTLDDHGGPDALFSLTPLAFAEMVVKVRTAEQVLHSDVFDPAALEARRGAYLKRGVLGMQRVSPHDMDWLRPRNEGLGPLQLEAVLGASKRSTVYVHDLPAGTLLTRGDITYA